MPSYKNCKFTSDWTVGDEEGEAFNEMMHFLVNARSGTLFDTHEGTERREKVIIKLNIMLKEWAIEVGRSRDIPEEALENGGGIHTEIFGSNKLGVHHIDSDIDILCVAPSYVTRDDFFSSFRSKLNAAEGVENMMAIPEAYTPVIKFLLDNQAVDMVFASLGYSPIPVDIDVLDLKWLRGMDEQSVRSFNGVRVAKWIEKLVPDMTSFRITLRLIKYWAKQRGLYSNILGFLGGVNCAILVALVCQSYENLSPYWLVRRFFDLYTLWSWPTPVMLRKYEDLEFEYSDGRYMPVWNPLANFKDSLQIMPIITPAYPAMNSAYNVAQPQFRCVVDEFVRGHVLFNQHVGMKGFPWETLCEAATKEFFHKFPHYVQIDIKAKSPEEHRIWFGWVESKIRLLILSLEQPPTIFSHPYANCFHRQPNGSKFFMEARTPGDYAGGALISFGNQHYFSPTKVPVQDGLSARYDGAVNIGVEEKGVSASSLEATQFRTPTKNHPDTSSDLNNSYISSFFIGISFRKDQPYIDLSFPIEDFKKKIMSWPQRTSDMMLDITDCLPEDLPSFVFTVTAEPSNIKSCTPKPRSRKQLKDNLVVGVPFVNLSSEEHDEAECDLPIFNIEGVEEGNIVTSSIPGDSEATLDDHVNQTIADCYAQYSASRRGIVTDDQIEGESAGVYEDCAQFAGEGRDNLITELGNISSPTRLEAAPLYVDDDGICDNVPSSSQRSVAVAGVPITINSPSHRSTVPPLQFSQGRCASRSNSFASAGSMSNHSQTEEHNVKQFPNVSQHIVSGVQSVVVSEDGSLNAVPPIALPVSPLRVFPRMPRPQHMDFHVQEHSSGFMDNTGASGSSQQQQIHGRAGSFDETPPMKNSSSSGRQNFQHNNGNGHQAHSNRNSPRGNGNQKFFGSPASTFRNNQGSYPVQPMIGGRHFEDGVYEDKSVPPPPLKFGSIPDYSSHQSIGGDEIVSTSGGGSRRGSFNHGYNFEEHGSASSNMMLNHRSAGQPYDELSSPKKSRNTDFSNSQDFSFRHNHGNINK